MSFLMKFLYRLFIGPRNTRLDWHTLSTLVRDANAVRVYDIKEREKSPADRAIQVRGRGESVKYFRSHRGKDSTLIESLDVLRRGELGFAITFHNGVPIVLTRVGGRNQWDPTFSPQEHSILQGLLSRMRAYAEQEKIRPKIEA